MENKIVQEVAEAEFSRFADAMDLDVDASAMTEDDRKGFNDQKNRVIRAIMRGALIVNAKGEPEYTTQRGDNAGVKLTFHEPRGASLMAMDRKKKGEDIGKTYAVMAEMCKVDAVTFARMELADLKVCQAIFVLFLG